MQTREQTISDLVQSLTDYAEAVGAPTDALDSFIYEADGENGLSALNEIVGEDEQEDFISNVEVSASGVNNEGFPGQIRFLIEGYSDLQEGAKDIHFWLTQSVAKPF